MSEEFHGQAAFVLQGFKDFPVYFAFAGVFLAWLFYVKRPDLPAKLAATFSLLYKWFANKFYIDELYQAVFAKGSLGLGKALWKFGDAGLIDGLLVNGSARLVGYVSSVVRGIQSGYLYWYAFSMIIGLAALLAWSIWW
jgi:NADH-quinone oxidoreductase subunit L